MENGLYNLSEVVKLLGVLGIAVLQIILLLMLLLLFANYFFYLDNKIGKHGVEQYFVEIKYYRISEVLFWVIHLLILGIFLYIFFYFKLLDVISLAVALIIITNVVIAFVIIYRRKEYEN